MTFKLMPLPYDMAALEPAISRRTIEFHHGKHHAAYVAKLNQLLEGNDMARLSLPEIIRRTAQDEKSKAVFNNAGQIWNHDFFWQCMRPDGGGTPPAGGLRQKVESDFGSFDKLRDAFIKAAVGQFGSGWAWLVQQDGRLKVMATANAVPPMTSGAAALLTCDVWEHAYYLDYQNRREAFVEAFLDKLVNWEFVARQWEEAAGADVESAGARPKQRRHG
jgi:superoxide dismutase, Fe-Mn family